MPQHFPTLEGVLIDGSWRCSIIKAREISLDDAATRISSILRRKKAALLLGAGISRDSGIPLSEQIIDAVLEECKFQIRENQRDLNKLIGLEFVLGNLERWFDLSTLLDIFRADKPNEFHRIVASLVNAGYVKEVATTNFDRLIENALDEIGLTRDVDYEFLGRKSVYDEFLLPSRSKLPKLIKLHGDIEFPESIMLTNNVNKGVIISKERNILKYIFSGWGKYLLVVGYSFNDSETVNEIIEKLPKLVRKKIILVNYEPLRTNTASISSLGGYENSRHLAPLNGFKGFVITCDSLTLMHKVATLVQKDDTGDGIHHEVHSSWKDYAHMWGNEANQKGRFYILLANLYNEYLMWAFGQDQELWYHINERKAELVAESTNSEDKRELAERQIEMAEASKYIFHDSEDRILVFYQRSLEIAQSIGDLEITGLCYLNISEIYRERNEELFKYNRDKGYESLSQVLDQQRRIDTFLRSDSSESVFLRVYLSNPDPSMLSSLSSDQDLQKRLRQILGG